MLTKLTNRLQPKVELTGLDIGTASVKLVRLLKDKDGYTAAAAAKQEIQGASEEGFSPDAVVAAVKQCLQKADIPGRDLVCGVAGAEVMVRGFKFPPLPDEAVEQAVRLEIQQVCPFESSQVMLDYQLVGDPETPASRKAPKSVARSGLMVACTENIIRQKKAILTQAGARPILVDADALAMLNCLTELELLDTQGVAAIIDVGWEYTNVVIYGQDGLPFVRDLNNAGRQIVQTISRDLKLPADQVRRALAGESLEDVDQTNHILLALNNAVRPLALAINETLRFYTYQEKTVGVETIYLCGGFAMMDTFMEFFADALPVEVRLFDPFVKIDCRAGDEGNQLLKKGGPGFVVAAGLAMRTI